MNVHPLVHTKALIYLLGMYLKECAFVSTDEGIKILI